MNRVTRPGPGSRVTVVGLARSGAAAVRWLRQMRVVVQATEIGESPALRQTAREIKALGVPVELGRHTREFIQGSELLVVSPGMPLWAKPIQWAVEWGIPVVSELECASWYNPGPLVAVTGSNGKSSVVTLLGRVFEAAGKEAVVCGNIGRPMSGFLGQIRPSTTVIAEVSSFQLETHLSFNPLAACLLNLTENHLDRHGTMENYRQIKARLFKAQRGSGWAVFNADDPYSEPLRSRVPAQTVSFSRRRKVDGAYLQKGEFVLNLPWVKGPVCPVEALALSGPHHEENALAVITLAALMGIPVDKIRQGLRTFQGLAHRQQKVATLRGLTFINDSKATTVAAGLRAIESAPGPVVLIAGGRDKGGPFKLLKQQAGKLKAVVLIGEDGGRIEAALQGAVPSSRSEDLPSAVRAAFDMAKAGESVLLSPMCTSFDMFRNFEERGDRFMEAVTALTAGNGSKVHA